MGWDRSNDTNHSTFRRWLISPLSQGFTMLSPPASPNSEPAFSFTMVQISGFECQNPRHTFPSACLHHRSCLLRRKHLKTETSCPRSTFSHCKKIVCDLVVTSQCTSQWRCLSNWRRLWLQIKTRRTLDADKTLGHPSSINPNMINDVAKKSALIS